MQRAAETFHMPTADGWRTIAAGAELADDDPAVTTAPQYFVPAEPEATVPQKPAARAKSQRTRTKG